MALINTIRLDIQRLIDGMSRNDPDRHSVVINILTNHTEVKELSYVDLVTLIDLLNINTTSFNVEQLKNVFENGN